MALGMGKGGIPSRFKKNGYSLPFGNEIQIFLNLPSDYFQRSPTRMSQARIQFGNELIHAANFFKKTMKFSRFSMEPFSNGIPNSGQVQSFCPFRDVVPIYDLAADL